MSVCGLAQGGVATVGSQVFVPCFDGLRRVLDAPGTTLKVDWHAAGQITLPPIVGGHTLYSLDPGGTLYALDTETGLVRAQLSLGMAVPHFTTPALSQGRIFVGTFEGVSAVTIDGGTGQKAPGNPQSEKMKRYGTAFYPISAIRTARRRKGCGDVV